MSREAFKRRTHHALTIQVASSFLRRLVGLMGRKAFPDCDGLLLTRTASVHTCFMHFPIDVICLGGEGEVLARFDRIPPWRMCFGPRGTRHILEMSAGRASRFGIELGDNVRVPVNRPGSSRGGQRGASLVEFVIVAPLISLMGLGIIQYALLFFAKGNINHAAFMAARAGANANADLGAVRNAYLGSLVPMYAKGQSPQALVDARAAAEKDLAGFIRIELLNPTKESFDDWNDPKLQQKLKTGAKRVIPNSGLAYKSVTVKAASGQSLQDANIIKLRITQGFEPKVPLISGIYTRMLGWLDPNTDGFHTSVVQRGRIPVVTHVALQMNTDAIEPDAPVTMPGSGNSGKPVDPGDPPVSQKPMPVCLTAGCTVIKPPGQSPACNPATDPNECRPIGCAPGDAKCDPACDVTMCCTSDSSAVKK
jgi:uncharacterized membrane protein (UPF0127 family)